jgi:hypothetical protein
MVAFRFRHYNTTMYSFHLFWVVEMQWCAVLQNHHPDRINVHNLWIFIIEGNAFNFTCSWPFSCGVWNDRKFIIFLPLEAISWINYPAPYSSYSSVRSPVFTIMCSLKFWTEVTVSLSHYNTESSYLCYSLSRACVVMYTVTATVTFLPVAIFSECFQNTHNISSFGNMRCVMLVPGLIKPHETLSLSLIMTFGSCFASVPISST